MKSNELIADMKNDYLGNYACVNISRDDLKKPHYQSIADLLKKEIDFVIKELK
ncbi:hypothetical protein HX055_18250 [Myroides odoratimimus]|nr:hypothetical protein [Myroides odoratimimus]